MASAERRRRWRANRFAAVAQRDGWVCHLCGKRIDPNARRRSKLPTLDHLLPKSLGGGGRRENLALAHWGCNHARGNALLVYRWSP
jgi:5-methylcytosine-specific restriction endonuclease McrA